ncbi:eukaryotic translation initiation factor 5B [Neodiprion pinetum]|uniref:eukaryotic translation initiation factor 5B n=1 Tax=Neodiprion pinetum TaxID=441929 RepID=UPI001EDF06B5|nr:eukaryotic translation initiation factor 5B [Neodiprion pinetum]
MGKAKKGKRAGKEEEMDSDVDVEDQTIEEPVKTKVKGKDKKKKQGTDASSEKFNEKKRDESTDESEDEKPRAKGKPKKGKKSQDSDDDFEMEKPKVVAKAKAKVPAKSGFALLQMEGDDDDDNDDDEEDIHLSDNDSEEAVSVKNTKLQQQQKKQEPQGKKGKKGKKKRNDSEEDIEKVLAELELEYSGQKKEPAIVETVTEKLQTTNISKKDIEEKDENKEDELNENEGEGGTVKTAAQKKKEKKERERQKKLAQKKAEAVKKSEGVTLSQENKTTVEVIPKPTEEKVDRTEKETDLVEGDDDGGEEDNKKKKKKGAKEDPKDKDKGKGPGKKTIAAMQEALKKLKEDEEKLRREEEERIREEEMREKARLEQLQLEQERKEKKKLKEKQRKERLKAEGKLLTSKQKLDRARAQAMIDALKAKGVDLPDVGEKKARPGTRVRPSKVKQQLSTEEKEKDEEKKSESVENPDQVQVEIVDQQLPEEPKKEAEVKDSWDAESTEEEQEEDQFEETSKPEKPTAQQIAKSQQSPGKKESSASESETVSGSESETQSESDDDSEPDDKKTDAERKKERARNRIQTRRIEAEKKKTLDNLRAAVVCVLGHVDTGKTKILDKLRRTNVQDGEAGGITQQIGATNVPIEAIQESTRYVKGFADKKFKIPGLLIIDTPGHESFSNLRNRGSSLCDIAILVVDIMHGLEPQTIESINLLKAKKCPFVVALNKIDRLYDWQTMSRKDVQDVIKNQAPNTQREFETRAKEVVVQFAEQALNAALFYENPDPRSYISLVPTSAVTGEGMGNLLGLVVDACQGPLAKRLMFSEELQATVLEVKALPGLGTTIDCILVNGTLREGDTMIVAGTDGPIVTQIRSLLMPQPLKELRVKNAYIEYREIKAAQGVKIAAKDLEKAIAGLNLQVAQKPDEVELLREETARELTSALGHIKLAERGVYVQASTLGALEALLDFLRSSKIPYAGIRIGPVVKKDIMKASIMLEHDSQYATILAFDVKIEKDAQELADSVGVKIFQADIIYHLFDKFTAYREELKQRKRDENKHIAVFPCKLRVLPQFIFNSRDPIVVGVMVEAGIVKEGTPICVPSKEFVELGIVTSIEYNHKSVETARKGQEVCVKIEPVPGEAPKMFGRHFDEKDFLVSKISRQSIDACKDYFRDDLHKTDWQLMVELKKLFQIL